MQILEVSVAVRHICMSLGVKGLTRGEQQHLIIKLQLCVSVATRVFSRG
jgi:hypothetical protein